MRVLISFDPTILRPVGERWMYGPSKSIRDKLNAMCVPGPADEKDGSGQIQREWRIWPATENGQPTDVSLARKVFKDAWNNKGPEKRDWILIGDGKVGYSGPLPKPEAEVLALLAKFGGK